MTSRGWLRSDDANTVIPDVAAPSLPDNIFRADRAGIGLIATNGYGGRAAMLVHRHRRRLG